MVQYIKSFQDKKDTSESMQQERMNTLQQSMNAHEAHFKEFSEPKKVEEIDFSDPKPDPSTFTPIEQILDNKQLERSADNKIETVLKEMQELKSIMLDIQRKLNEETS
jgi:DNA repair exonuclease SbcCD ATPase subunit